MRCDPVGVGLKLRPECRTRHFYRQQFFMVAIAIEAHDVLERWLRIREVLFTGIAAREVPLASGIAAKDAYCRRGSAVWACGTCKTSGTRGLCGIHCREPRPGEFAESWYCSPSTGSRRDGSNKYLQFACRIAARHYCNLIFAPCSKGCRFLRLSTELRLRRRPLAWSIFFQNPTK